MPPSVIIHLWYLKLFSGWERALRNPWLDQCDFVLLPEAAIEMVILGIEGDKAEADTEWEQLLCRQECNQTLQRSKLVRFWLIFSYSTLYGIWALSQPNLRFWRTIYITFSSYDLKGAPTSSFPAAWCPQTSALVLSPSWWAAWLRPGSSQSRSYSLPQSSFLYFPVSGGDHTQKFPQTSAISTFAFECFIGSLSFGWNCSVCFRLALALCSLCASWPPAFLWFHHCPHGLLIIFLFVLPCSWRSALR